MNEFLKPGTPLAPGFRRFWQKTSGPSTVVGDLVMRGESKYGHQQPQWADHAYCYKDADGNWVWMAEPYPNRDGSLVHQAEFDADKAKLEAAGYSVRIDQSEARYNPGETLPIIITRRPR
ncbi:hypothetical protein ABT213_06145 [Streptomyces sp. NPDC001674]|uniref:hypothetical protein n=1 Tax=Streptomyces sp. NPDC001674 TaxID=3154394 RepID=UPI00332B1068